MVSQKNSSTLSLLFWRFLSQPSCQQQEMEFVMTVVLVTHSWTTSVTTEQILFSCDWCQMHFNIPSVALWLTSLYDVSHVCPVISLQHLKRGKMLPNMINIVESSNIKTNDKWIHGSPIFVFWDMDWWTLFCCLFIWSKCRFLKLNWEDWGLTIKQKDKYEGWQKLKV